MVASKVAHLAAMMAGTMAEWKVASLAATTAEQTAATKAESKVGN